MTPGSNLLKRALKLIRRQTISYYQFINRSLNGIGQDITVYATPINIVGSFQAVPRNLYDAYGLVLQKSYYTFYTSTNAFDIARDISGDQIVFNGRKFQCESNNDWFALDGWKGILCVDISASGS